MKIYLGADHAGFERKEKIKAYLQAEGFDITDLGAKQLNPEDDYPDYAYPVAKEVAADHESRGLLFCGNAEGVCIVANKVDGIRSALGYSIEAAKTSREDDDANILCLPGRELEDKEIEEMVRVWLLTPFSGEERHVRRISKIKKIEKEQSV